MRRSRTLVTMLAGLLVFTMLSGCGGRSGPDAAAPPASPPGQRQASPGSDTSQPTTDKGGQEFVYNLGTEPPSLDPAILTDVASFTVAGAIYEGLTRITARGIEPGVAERWEASADGMRWTFHLREARWTNGDPVTAHDFVYAWRRALDPRTAAEYAYQLYYLKGGEAFNTAALPEQYGKDAAVTQKADADLDALAGSLGVRAVNDRTLAVELANPTPYFLNLTAFPTYYPVNRQQAAANPNWAAEAATIVGNGPFRVAEWAHKDKLVITKNPDYWDAGQVRLDRITFRMIEEESTALTMFTNGELHVNDAIPSADIPRLLKSGEAKRSSYLGTYYFMLNTGFAPFNDAKVRKALSLAIDRQQIVDNVTRGGQQPATALVPAGIKNPATGRDFREEGGAYVTFNPDQARQLLAEAGYPEGKGFPEFTILYNTSESHKSIAEAIQQMWASHLGLTNIKLANMEWKVYLAETNNGNYQVARMGWIGDYLDPMTFVDLWVSGSGFNSTGWSNSEYDGLVETAKKTGDQEVRFASMRKAEAILMDEMPILPIYFYVRIYQEQPWVKGIYRDAVAGTDFKYAYVERH